MLDKKLKLGYVECSLSGTTCKQWGTVELCFYSKVGVTYFFKLRKNVSWSSYNDWIILELPELTGYRDNDDHFPTKAIHVGQKPEQWSSMAVIPPITLSSIFKQYAPGKNKGYA